MKIIPCDQYTPEWWAVRRGVPTASRADQVVTPKQWKPSSSAYGYALELIGDQYDPFYGACEDYQTAAMKNGSLMEPEARAYFEFETGKTVKEVGFCVTDDGRFGCSPDGLVEPDSGLELKCPAHKTHLRYLLEDATPAAYLPQIHWSMIVTGRRSWWFMSYARKLPPLLKCVHWDERTDQLIEAMDAFYATYADVRDKVRDRGASAEAFEDRENEKAELACF